MNHSILDGTPADTLPGTSSPPGRTRVRDCMSRPGAAVTPGTGVADHLSWDLDDMRPSS